MLLTNPIVKNELDNLVSHLNSTVLILHPLQTEQDGLIAIPRLALYVESLYKMTNHSKNSVLIGQRLHTKREMNLRLRLVR